MSDILKLDGSTFHVIEYDEKYHLTETEDAAIEQMQTSIDGETTPDDVNIYTVTANPDDEDDDADWKIEQVPWATIALKVLTSD